MKKLFILLIITFLPVVGYSANQDTKETKEKIIRVMDQYGHEDGVESIKLGRMALAALRGAARIGAAGDRESQEAIDFLSNVKTLYILEYDSCGNTLKNEIDRKVTSALKNAELLMEANDGTDKMKIYSNFSEKNNTISDFILYTPSEHAIICITGTFSIDDLSNLKSLKK